MRCGLILASLLLLVFLFGQTFACNICEQSKKIQQANPQNAVQQGCKGFGNPPIPYYPNLFPNSTFTSIPASYLERMKQLVAEVSEMIVSDYPATYKSEYEPFVYWGTSGRAAMCLRMYRDTGNWIWVERAKDYIDVSLAGVKPYNYTGMHFAFQKGRTGIISVAAVVYDLIQKHGSNQIGASQDQVKDFIKELNWFFDQVNENGDDYYDWESGMSGLVYAGEYVNTYFNDWENIVPRAKIERVLQAIYRAGLKFQHKFPNPNVLQFELYQNHFWTGFGSHGLGSPVYTLLKSTLFQTNETIRFHVIKTLEYLLELQTPKGQIPGDLQPDRTQWCHGIPGILPLFGMAYRLLNSNSTYLKAGLLGSRLTSEIGILAKGMQFCHGTGGNIYMILDFYKHTGNVQALQYAISMIMTSLDTPQLTDPQQWQSYDCLPDGMFVSSSIGMVLLYSDLIRNANNLANVQMVSFHISV